MAPGQIRVNIFGNEYTLLSENNDDYVKEIARYIDDKMREIDRSNQVKSTVKVAILAALNIADELYQERLYRKKLLEQINEEAKKINRGIIDVLQD
jgi:cell division protein ZapA